MKKSILGFIALTVAAFCAQGQTNSLWQGKKCAVVLTYDDAIDQHLDHAIPVLDSLGLKATFYLTAFSSSMQNRLPQWKKLSAKGYELGNHTLYHPCVGGAGREWVKAEYDLDNYTVKRMVDEVKMTNVFLEALDGKKERTFAFTCGDMKVNDTLFYPYLQNDFVAARAVRSQMHQLKDIKLDDMDCYMVNGETGEQLINLVKQAEATNSLLVFLFHGVGGGNALNVSLPAHRQLLQYLKSKQRDIWVAPMLTVAKYIKAAQASKETGAAIGTAPAGTSGKMQTGNQPAKNTSDKVSLTYSNPILSGFYPDPSICQVGDDYYLINSSFVYFPGIPIFHSKDLVNWRQIGNVINRPSQVNFDNAGVSRGLFAPDLTYHKGLFYLVCTLVDKGGNFVITATNPAGPWSDPVFLKEVNGIDPALFFDHDDKAYIIFNSEPPNNISLHDGHRTIRMFEFDYKNLKIKGDEKLLINGGTDMAIKPVWIEGPHIFKKDEWYYMICAQGGTGYNHSEVVFRSKDLNGPYISFEKNPILTQKHLDRSRKDPVTTTGHADFVQTKNGDWYAVFLACRPYMGEHYNLGRETFMLPVKWENGWPMILEGDEVVGKFYPVPLPGITKKVDNPFNDSGIYTDEFNADTLSSRFVFLRVPQSKWYDLQRTKGMLAMNLLPQTCSQKQNPAFVGFRQSHMNGAASTALRFSAKQENEKAGLLVFQNEHHYYLLCQSVKNGQPVVQLYKSTDSNDMELLAEKIIPVSNEVELKITSEGAFYHFSYALKKNEWKSLAKNIDATYLSTQTAGGFVGCVYAMYATSQGKPSDNKVLFDWFKSY